MENKNTGLIVLVVVLSMLVLGLGGFIVYDKVLLSNESKVENNENSNKNEEINNSENTNENTDSIATKKVSVETAVDYVDEYYKKFNVKLPKIAGNSNKIEELNKKILNDILPKTYFHTICHAMMEDECMDKGSSVNYEYLIKDNIVIIYIYSFVPEGGMSAPASGGGLFSANYFYDITNDKILTLAEATDKLNIKDLDGATSSKDLIDGCSSMLIENNNVKISYNEGCV